jgi:hypothetical protein
VHGVSPFVERDFAALHDGADRHRELLTTLVALIDTGTVFLAFKRRCERGHL